MVLQHQYVKHYAYDTLDHKYHSHTKDEGNQSYNPVKDDPYYNAHPNNACDPVSFQV
jgi:hypothetical protein